MNETFKFLKENTQVNFLATIDGNKPSLRPFGDPFLYDGKIYVITNKKKNVSKQIALNNNVCIVAYDDENWIRINCQLIDDSDNVVAKKKAIQEYDWAEAAGYTLDNPDFQILYLSNVSAVLHDEEGHQIHAYTF
ncbi:MAG: pyridoxamine 5'-phosphate oxidase family protein [Alphaproteobacteria bacterium]|nr:pyridoxamine 5'-phosphate oxidase family protein [Alphaproteobacteria bacterium]